MNEHSQSTYSNGNNKTRIIQYEQNLFSAPLICAPRFKSLKSLILKNHPIERNINWICLLKNLVFIYIFDSSFIPSFAANHKKTTDRSPVRWHKGCWLYVLFKGNTSPQKYEESSLYRIGNIFYTCTYIIHLYWQPIEMSEGHCSRKRALENKTSPKAHRLSLALFIFALRLSMLCYEFLWQINKCVCVLSIQILTDTFVDRLLTVRKCFHSTNRLYSVRKL